MASEIIKGFTNLLDNYHNKDVKVAQQLEVDKGIHFVT